MKVEPDGKTNTQKYLLIIKKLILLKCIERENVVENEEKKNYPHSTC